MPKFNKKSVKKVAKSMLELVKENEPLDSQTVILVITYISGLLVAVGSLLMAGIYQFDFWERVTLTLLIIAGFLWLRYLFLLIDVSETDDPETSEEAEGLVKRVLRILSHKLIAYWVTASGSLILLVLLLADLRT